MNKIKIHLGYIATFITILSAFAFLVWHISVYINKVDDLQQDVQTDSILLHEQDAKLAKIELAELDCVKKFEYIIKGL